MIQKKIDADVLRIETVVPYSTNYNQVVNQGQDEVNRGYCPKLKPVDINLDQYDTIILGTPVWWYTFAPAMHTFLKSQNWKGKLSTHSLQTAAGLGTHLKTSRASAGSSCKKGHKYPL